MSKGAGVRVDVRIRAIKLISDSFGKISDLPEELRSVIWVTTYRSCEVTMNMEANGGANALVKVALQQGGQAAFKMEQAIRRFGLLKDIIPIIRNAKSNLERLADTQLLVDMLKWDISNAGEISGFRRALARKLAKPDGLFEMPPPNEIL